MSKPRLQLDDVYGNSRPINGHRDPSADDLPAPDQAEADSASRPASTSAAKSPRRSAARSPAPAKPTATGVASEELLNAAATQLNVTIPDALFQATRQRASEVGVPLRSVVVDALIAALDLEPDAHRDRAHATHLAEYAVRMRRRNA